MKLTDAIATRLKTILDQRGYTAYKIAKLGGVPLQVVYSVLRSEYKKISIDVIYQLTATLGMSLADFFADPIFDEVTD